MVTRVIISLHHSTNFFRPNNPWFIRLLLFNSERYTQIFMADCVFESSNASGDPILIQYVLRWIVLFSSFLSHPCQMLNVASHRWFTSCSESYIFDVSSIVSSLILFHLQFSTPSGYCFDDSPDIHTRCPSATRPLSRWCRSMLYGVSYLTFKTCEIVIVNGKVEYFFQFYFITEENDVTMNGFRF